MDKFLERIERHYVKKGRKIKLPDARVRDAQAFPIAHGMTVPGDFPSGKAALSLRLTDRTIQHFGSLNFEKCKVERDGGRVKATFAFEPMYLSFDAVVEAVDDAASVGGVDSVVFGNNAVDNEKEEWLESARRQRTKLSGTANGQQMLMAYGKHNEIYEELFRESTAMKMIWKAGGITKDMSRDTYGAIENGGEINKKEKKYTSEDGKTVRTYNTNAFLQQSAVAQNTLYLDPNFDPLDPGSVPEARYYEAAKAAANFGAAIENTTGNKKDVINPMTGEAVYQAVDKGLPKTNSRNNMLASGAAEDARIRSLMAAMSRVCAPVSNASTNNAVLDDAFGAEETLSDEELEIMRFSYASALEDRRRAALRKPLSVGTGRCAANLGSITVEADVSEGAVTVGAIAVSDIAIAVDGEALSGEISETLKKELPRMDFLKGLLADDIAEAMRESLIASIKEAYDETK